jgi:predicted transcriptional regulator
MSYRELSMIEVKEVLRRREAGQALREIARETGLDRKTVRRYVDAAGETDGEVDTEVVHPAGGPGGSGASAAATSEARERLDAASRVDLELAEARDKKGTRALRLTKVHELLQRRGVDVTYATLCRWAHDELGWRERKPTVRVDDPEPGQEAQADFGKMGMLFDPAQGRNGSCGAWSSR